MVVYVERTSEKRITRADQGMAPASALPEGRKKGSSNAARIAPARDPQRVSKIPKNAAVEMKKPKPRRQLLSVLEGGISGSHHGFSKHPGGRRPHLPVPQ